MFDVNTVDWNALPWSEMAAAVRETTAAARSEASRDESETAPYKPALLASRAKVLVAEKSRKQARETLKFWINLARWQSHRVQQAIQIAVAQGNHALAGALHATIPQIPHLEGVGFKTLTKARVVDATQIPREYLIPDMGKIEEALRGGVDVPGARLETEQTITV